MGFIIDTRDKLLILERRRTSYIIMDRERVHQPGQSDPRKFYKSKHIFANADGEIEMSAEFLHRLIYYFRHNPEEYDQLARMAGERDGGN